MIIECRECKRDMSDKANTCLHCGCPSLDAEKLGNAIGKLALANLIMMEGLYKKSSRSWRFFKTLFWAIVLFVVIFIIF